MTEVEKLKTLSFWYGHLWSCVENYRELSKDDPDTFDMPEEITVEWARQLLDDHLNCTDEMYSAYETYELNYGEIDGCDFDESYELFVATISNTGTENEASTTHSKIPQDNGDQGAESDRSLCIQST